LDLTIPKRIIQTGKSFDLPLLSKAAVANIRLLNPEFEYLFFDDIQVNQFIKEKFPEYQGVFNTFDRPIQRYDFFRYLAVYHFGGFYFDLDVFLSSNLSDLLSFSCVFPFEELTIHKFLRRTYGMDWEIGNYAFGAAAGHPFIEAIIQNCVKAQRDPKWPEAMMASIPRMLRENFYVFNTTGPGLVSRTLAEYPDAGRQVKVLFPENVCNSIYWHHFGSFGVHLMEGTWYKHKSLLRRRLANFWMSWTRKRLLKESLLLGESRSLERLHKKI
jgi:inositol phosphorylceramide mannosyltransferase catalytic subunit